MKRKTAYAFLAALLAAAFSPARADTIFTVTLNTASLAGSPGSSAGPFDLAFQLTDGSGLGDTNNTATLRNFQFGGGSAGACPANCVGFGGASGSAASSIVLTDTTFFNALVEGFTPGSTLSFLVDLTTNVDSGGTPDTFAFSLLDSSGFSIPTLDSSGADSLLTVTLDSAKPAILAYGSDVSRLTNGGSGVALSLAAPTIGSPGGPSVPEPGTLLLVTIGFAGLILAQRKPLKRPKS
jgi:hypothetical protein